MKTTVKLIGFSAVATEKARKDGKVSRQFYTAEFSDPTNPFAAPVKRTFFQQHSIDGTTASWKGGDPATLKAWVGKEIPGYIANRNVEQYTVTVPDGKGGQIERPASTFTTVILGGENEEKVFRNAGKPLAGTGSVSSTPASTNVVAEEEPMNVAMKTK